MVKLMKIYKHRKKAIRYYLLYSIFLGCILELLLYVFLVLNNTKVTLFIYLSGAVLYFVYFMFALYRKGLDYDCLERYAKLVQLGICSKESVLNHVRLNYTKRCQKKIKELLK